MQGVVTSHDTYRFLPRCAVKEIPIYETPFLIDVRLTTRDTLAKLHRVGGTLVTHGKYGEKKERLRPARGFVPTKVPRERVRAPRYSILAR
jgi:hypothetical protein